MKKANAYLSTDKVYYATADECREADIKDARGVAAQKVRELSSDYYNISVWQSVDERDKLRQIFDDYEEELKRIEREYTREKKKEAVKSDASD